MDSRTIVRPKDKGKTPTRHFFDYFNERVPANWKEPALTDYDGDKSYTFGEMADRMVRLQLLLEAAGMRRGDKVALCSKNCANWAVSFLSIAANRGVIVSIMDAFTGADIEKLVNHSDARALFVGESVWKRVDINNMPEVQLVISTADFSVLYARTEVQKNAPAAAEKAYSTRFPNGFGPADVKLPTDNLDELMLINYTSGTTSEPKGAMLSYRNISANVHFSQETIPNHAGWNEVCMLPLAHMFGMSIEFLYQVAGGCHVYFLSKTPSPTVLMRAYAETHPYMILTVPLVLEKIFKAKIFPSLEKPLVKFLWNTPVLCKIVEKKIYNSLMEAFGGNLIWLITGGAAINAEVEKIFRRIKFPFVVGYGMTEAGPLICYDDWYNEVQGCCGKVVDRNELRIDSPDPENVVGEILVRGEHVMMGYYKNPEATAAAIDKDGWLHTGDLGTLSKAGHLFIRGRSKAMILSSNGQNIYPEELEDKINNLPGVVESVVVGRGGKLVALVFPDEKYNCGNKTMAEVMEENRKRVNPQLPQYAQISEFELVDKEFEKTPKRSIRRFLYK
ncbi:MAG: AMP-binding protein [Paludibacteraceae bacterium]|nr:AMP-binding protein [Paludibacteraceae bacterium]